MKKVAILFVLMIIFIVGCDNKDVLEPDSPINTAYLMKRQIDIQNYSSFQSLFFDGRENTISKEAFKEFGEITTAGSGWKNYELITFTNGEMLLVEFAAKLKDEDDIKIVNVKLVPEEMKDFFK